MRRPRLSVSGLALFCALATVLAACVFQFRSPIVKIDFDLWYHLAAGRFIWRERALPRFSFFSFLTPPRRWLDYSWLFDSLSYAVYSACGYQGLVILRASLYSATILTIGAVLFRFRGKGWEFPVWRCLLFSFYSVFLISRFSDLRPHVFSYLFIVLSIYLLEFKPGWSAALIVLGALWGNIHGIYYPVWLLITGAYVAEYFLVGRRDQSARAGRERALALIAVSMAACFLTPLGAALIDIPFTPLHYVGLHIRELMPLSLRDIFSFAVSGWAPDHHTIFKFIFYSSLLAALSQMLKRRMRPSRLILLIGAAVLLAKARRFSYEWALLSLPLLREWRPLEGVHFEAAARRLLAVPLLAVMAMPAVWLAQRVPFLPAYPFSWRSLPHGTSAFLNEFGGGGSVLNDPDAGGYLEWALNPSYKIAMDMRVPHLFDDDDWYAMSYDFTNEPLFKLLAARYHPEFIAAPLMVPAFKDVIAKFPRYVPVFLDDRTALYADTAARPALAKYALPVDPYHLPPPGQDKSPKEKSKCALPLYLARLIAVDPHIFSVQALAAQYCEIHKDFGAELEHGKIIVRDYPEEAWGYLIEGNALRQMGREPRSLAALKTGLRRADPDSTRLIAWEMSDDYKAMKHPGAALAVLKREGAAGALAPPDWAKAEDEYRRGLR
ncbi:MAG: hypothetical protein ACYCPQ_07975 [Elusimicrobiota bacterium]